MNLAGSVQISMLSWYVKTTDVSGASIWDAGHTEWDSATFTWDKSGTNAVTTQRSGGTF